MAIWSDLAQWRGPSPNTSGRRYRTLGLVLHIAEGGYEGTISWGKNPGADVSYHFVGADDGSLAQIVDTDLVAWTQAAGNDSWMSIEFEGHTGRQLTAPMLESASQLFARVCKTYGVPCQLSNSPSTPGLGHHAMGGEAWGGHFLCPGQPIIDQKPLIVKRAAEILGGVPAALPTLKGSRMFFVQLTGHPEVFLSNGLEAVWLSPQTLSDFKTLAAEGRIDIPKTDVRKVGNRAVIGTIIGTLPKGYTANP